MRYLVILFIMFLPFEAFDLTAEEVMKKSQEVFFYQGKDFKARILRLG